MRKYLLQVVIEKDKDDYFAYCPALQGCYAQGDTYEEAMENIKDAIKLHLEDRREDRQSIPESQSISVTALEIAA